MYWPFYTNWLDTAFMLWAITFPFFSAETGGEWVDDDTGIVDTMNSKSSLSSLSVLLIFAHKGRFWALEPFA